MTTTVGASTSYPLTIPELSETADIQTAIKLIAYGQSADPTDDADIEANSIAGYIATKQATITGAATTIDTENLTASRALISNGSGKVAISATTSTELGYVSGVTSSIQTQINGIGKVLLETVTTSAGASTITFSSISQSYKSLEVVYTLGTGTELSGTSNTVSIRFSGDSGNNYAYSFASYSGNSGTNTTAPSYSNGFDQAQILIPVSHKSNTAIGSFTIDNYNSTAGSKIGFYNLYQDYISDQITTGTFAWKNRTTAITSMTITFNGSILTGQVVTAKLFGIN